MSKKSFLERVARMYYILGYNQQEISEQLEVGRSSVARFLQEARDAGIIQFRISSDLESWRCEALESGILHSTGIRDCVVLRSEERSGSSFETLTSTYLNSILPSHGSVGLGWGRTLYGVGTQMHLCDARPDLKLIQLSGGLGSKEELIPATSVVQQWSSALQGKPLFLPAPAVVATPESKLGFLAAPSIQDVLEQSRHIHVALVGIGHSGPDSTILTAELAPGFERELAASDLVGDIAFHFYNSKGEFTCHGLSERVIGISPEQFLEVDVRVGIAYGLRKVEAIKGALSGGLINILVTTEETARALIEEL